MAAIERARGVRGAAGLGLLAGTVHWGVATSWVVAVMHDYGKLALPLAFLCLLVMAGLLGLTWAAAAGLARLVRPGWRLWLLPAAFAALEAFRQWPPLLFPWNPTAASLTPWPSLLGSLPVWGGPGSAGRWSPSAPASPGSSAARPAARAPVRRPPRSR